jgi:N-acetylneuraminic acid mutarotase/uncharacterized GH25 family protein
MRLLLAMTASVLVGASAQAHFIWLAPTGSGSQARVCVYFGEDATDDSSDYLSRVNDVVISKVAGAQPARPLQMTRTDAAIYATIPSDEQCVYVAAHDFGIMDRGETTFRLMYYAKTGPEASSSVWQDSEVADDLKLDIVPTVSGDRVRLQVYFEQAPVAGAQIMAARPGADDIEVVTDNHGVATFAIADPGTYSIRARHIEDKPGALNGQTYLETRHYSTVALRIMKPDSTTATADLQDIPEPVTSFGAAVLGDGLYVYGGHTGGAHSYSKSEQGDHLLKLNLKTGKWEHLAAGPGLQGLALVTDGKKLYRIGGFTAMNAEGEEHDLWSQTGVASYDPAEGKWQELPALPERRSSHDAAVVGDTIYVVGGWAMEGDGDAEWHTNAWKMDLKQDSLQWQPIADPPFQRRALATAAHKGKLYVIGGMQHAGGPTTKVAVYDPQSDSWSEGPALLVKTAEESAEDGGAAGGMSSGSMTGFGASAFATGGSLYVTTVQGTLQRLSDDGSRWEFLPQAVSPRFFHRLLPLGDSQLVVVGGSNMDIGKFEQVEVIDLNSGT